MERSGVHGVGHEIIGDVEVRKGAVCGDQIGPEGSAERTVIAGIVHGFAEGVVRLKLQAVREAFGKGRGQAVIGTAPNRRKLIVLQDLSVRFARRRTWLGHVERSNEGIDRERGVLNVVGFLVLLDMHVAIVLVPNFDRQIASYFPGNAETALNGILGLEVV